MPVEERVSRLLEQMSDAFVCLDRNWCYTYVNRRAGEIFGRTPESLIGKHIWTEFPEGVDQPFQRAYERAVAEGISIKLEEFYPPYNRWFENRIHPGPEGLLIFFNDVTERHLAEEKIRGEIAARAQAERIAHLGFWQWDLGSGSLKWSDELYRIYGLEPGSRPIDVDYFYSCVHADDREHVRLSVEGAVKRGGIFSHRERIVWPDGSIRHLDTLGEAILDKQGRVGEVIGTCLDVTERVARESRLALFGNMVAGERRALEMLAAGAPLADILKSLCLLIESVAPGTLGSILLIDPTGTRVESGAAPSLPEAFTRAINGEPIGPRAGSCGTAAYRREAVFVSDIETDPLWENYRALAKEHGLRACWSHPILAADGRVLGTFAVYYREVRLPDDNSRELCARATHVAGLAIEKRRVDDQFRALADRSEQIREDERTGIARELHDQLGQELTAVKMDIAMVQRHLDDGELVQKKLGEMSARADALVVAIRRIAAELRPGILDDLGLQAAIEWQAAQLCERSQIQCEVRSAVGDTRLDRRVTTAAYRIFQEALTNVVRHAHATRVEVDLGLEEGKLRLEVADDGVGLPATAGLESSLGLLGMRERARRLGGDCELRRRDTRGTVVLVHLPLQRAAVATSPRRA